MSNPEPHIATAREVLHRAWQLTEPELRKSVNQLEDPLRTVAAYHFGWSDKFGRPTGTGSGKGVRGALAIASAVAAGGEDSDGVPAAVIVELVHNFSLLHDDIMDDDLRRRGRPSAWVVFGRAQAILTGDALLSLAFEVAADRSRVRHAVAADLSAALLDVVNGQSADMQFENRMDIGLEQWESMASGKSGALFGLACVLGGRAASADGRRIEALRNVGRHLGLAFQLVDDVLGLVGDPDRLGKTVGGDILRRKKSAPIVRALHSDPRLATILTTAYTRSHPPSSREAADIVALVEQSGVLDWARTEADRFRCAAMTELDTVSTDPQARRALEAIADAVLRWDQLSRRNPI
ncbi:polyprenyl synthetase family protein [Nocardia aurantiaca]|uniref:Polyprenyl synthetase family protein n=1 Tax=Nocardia aurantiaca TaxID=2675850 RepID=A0A6I3KRN1_9NOCA|nr:polyprenyl synthetase family protein [Nocardia aurantiaca]MTE12572.1 polyprenyl synthetase family protein [Nocardia aurantiaca]